MAIGIIIESQVSQTITDGVTDKAPSENVVFDALALKIGGAVSIGQVAFGTASGVGGDSGLFWDNTNKRLGVGTSTPTARLHVQSQGALSTDIAFRVRNSADTLDIIRAQGDGSVFVGLGAGNVNTGVNNSFFGIDAGRNNTTGGSNTANGREALRNNTTGGSNTANGREALFNNTTGGSNTANGRNALRNNTTGGSNTANGREALFNNTTGGSNTANGVYALFNNTTGDFNTANGVNALFNNTTGSNNSANGVEALRNNTTGGSNTANGREALRNNTTGGSNTANGREALFNNTTGGSNTANGVYALRNNTTGGSNTANGFQALFNNTTGANNTANGVNSGRFIADGTTANTITNNSVFLGAFTKAQSNNQTNQIVIGHDTTGNGSNTVTLGNTSIIKTFLRGTINAANLPTSATGLVAGDIWNDGGTLKIV